MADPQGLYRPAGCRCDSHGLRKRLHQADIVSYDDFVAAEGAMVKIKEEGKLRQEGRDYVMQDGDIVNLNSTSRSKCFSGSPLLRGAVATSD